MVSLYVQMFPESLILQPHNHHPTQQKKSIHELLSGEAYLRWVERQTGEPLSANARKLASWPWEAEFLEE